MEKLTKTSLRWVNVPKMLGSFVFAWRGLCQVVRHENNARVHLLATVGVGVAGVALGLSVGEWLAVLGLAVLVWVAELVNSAVERLVDLVSPQPHPLAGQAKDIAAGAVLVAAIGAAIGGLIIFGPKVAGLLGLA
jgi:diacylglycerol kinase